METLPRPPQTLSTSYLDPRQTPSVAVNGIEWVANNGISSGHSQDVSLRSFALGSTGKGILIGMLSAFGSAALVALILAMVYFFRYTSRGQIFLDRIGRPGEYDDEQAFLREEEQALEEMDDFQRAEYTRAKGTLFPLSPPFVSIVILTSLACSICTGQPSRVRPDRHIVISIPGNTREGRFCVGV